MPVSNHPASDTKPAAFKAASVKIGLSPVRVQVQPPATSPSLARRRALAKAIRGVTMVPAVAGE